jgi:hypothetical protein
MNHERLAIMGKKQRYCSGIDGRCMLGSAQLQRIETTQDLTNGKMKKRNDNCRVLYKQH